MLAGTPEYRLPSPMIKAIEDAVLFGNIQELDGVLEMAGQNEDFPPNLRYALEALMYLRMYYGKGGNLEPATEAGRQKVAQMESSWGREVIEMIGHYPDLTEARYA